MQASRSRRLQIQQGQIPCPPPCEPACQLPRKFCQDGLCHESISDYLVDRLEHVSDVLSGLHLNSSVAGKTTGIIETMGLSFPNVDDGQAVSPVFARSPQAAQCQAGQSHRCIRRRFHKTCRRPHRPKQSHSARHRGRWRGRSGHGAAPLTSYAHKTQAPLRPGPIARQTSLENLAGEVESCDLFRASNKSALHMPHELDRCCMPEALGTPAAICWEVQNCPTLSSPQGGSVASDYAVRIPKPMACRTPCAIPGPAGVSAEELFGRIQNGSARTAQRP